MERTPEKLTRLATLMADHQGVTHWAISQRIFGKGDFFANFLNGSRKDCRAGTAERAIDWFDQHWPEDLEWPCQVPRPSARSEDAA